MVCFGSSAWAQSVGTPLEASALWVVLGWPKTWPKSFLDNDSEGFVRGTVTNGSV